MIKLCSLDVDGYELASDANSYIRTAALCGVWPYRLTGDYDATDGKHRQHRLIIRREPSLYLDGSEVKWDAGGMHFIAYEPVLIPRKWWQFWK